LRLLIITFLSSFSFLYSFCQTIKSYDINDLRALNAIALKWELYWNSHNMDSLESLFSLNIDFVTKSGTWFKGKEATANHQKKNHTTIFKTSTWVTDSLEIKFVRADVAIIHIGWGLSGDYHHDGSPNSARHGISTWVIEKENKEWLLLAIQNVNIESPQ
jgi:uncharacterized protein (TIGR02246 family)